MSVAYNYASNFFSGLINGAVPTLATAKVVSTYLFQLYPDSIPTCKPREGYLDLLHSESFT